MLTKKLKLGGIIMSEIENNELKNDQMTNEPVSKEAAPASNTGNISHEEIDVEKTKDVKPEEVKAEEVKPEEVKAEAVTPEEVRPEETIYEQAINNNTIFNQTIDDTTFEQSASSNTTSDAGYTYASDDYVFVKPKRTFLPKRKLLIIVLVVIAAVCIAIGAYALFKNIALNSNDATSATNYALEDATGSPLSVQEIIKQNENSVVEITTESVAKDSWMQQYVTSGAGSGIIVDPAGYIATNSHVVSGANKVTVRLHSGNDYSAKVIATDPVVDVAVIKISASEELKAVTYGNSDQLQAGDLAVAIGNPLGQLGGTATTGIISALDREITIENQAMKLIQTDAAINPGNSGGGLFNGQGQLVGMVIAKSAGSNVEGLGFAIPVNTVAETVKQLITNGKVTGRPAAGITVTDVDAATAMQNGLKYTGVYITDVVGDNAKKSGLKKGDYIYYVDDQKIDSTATLKQITQSHKIGDTLTYVVIRNGQTVECKVTLEESTNFTDNNTENSTEEK